MYSPGCRFSSFAKMIFIGRLETLHFRDPAEDSAIFFHDFAQKVLEESGLQGKVRFHKVLFPLFRREWQDLSYLLAGGIGQFGR